jgi:uncharacterized protein
MKLFPLASVLLAASLLSAEPIVWQPWSDGVFDQARREHKFVLLDLEAIWCHWCHVMAETTYKDPQVVSLMQSKYIAVRVDQDSRPDLSNRYEDYGWPATVVFAADGSEIVKRQGYIEPKNMVSMLRAIIKDPSPGPSVKAEAKLNFGADSQLSATLRKDLTERFTGQYDSQHGSWGFDQKYLDWNGVEYSIILARAGDAQAGRMAKQTLEQQRKLIDPVWGGVYQYSVGGDWNEPHFEKIMAFQAENLRIYSIAYQEWKDPAYLTAALDVHRFLKNFLMSPEGAFYTSQDADLIEGKHSAEYFKLDDPGRRKQGIPRIDKHTYARENGWAINAVTALYAATGERPFLDEAVRAAGWVIANRSLPDGGFRHDEKDAAGPYLADTLAMGRAFLTIYGVTGDRKWLAHAVAAAKFIDGNFRDAQAGYVTSKAPTDRSYTPRQQRDENFTLARFANLLSRYTADPQHKQMADYAMRYLTEPTIARYLPTAGVLIADSEVSTDPVHITVVGHKDDAIAQALFEAAASYPAAYKRVEWWDTREGRLPNPDVQYPELKNPAAFVCTSNTCSAPIYQPEAVKPKVDKLTAVL